MTNLNPNDSVQVNLWIPRWLNNKIKDLAANNGLSATKLMILMLYEGSRDVDGLPKPPRGTPLPTVDDAVSAFAQGRKLRGPCGTEWSKCNYDKAQAVVLRDMEFCKACGIRTY